MAVMLPRTPSGMRSPMEAWPTSSSPWPAVCSEGISCAACSVSTTVEKSKSGAGGTTGSKEDRPPGFPSSGAEALRHPAAARRTAASAAGRRRIVGDPPGRRMNLAARIRAFGPGGRAGGGGSGGRPSFGNAFPLGARPGGMRTLAALAVLLLLSGCLSGPKAQPEPPVATPADAAAATFFVHDVGEQGAEPSIGVTSDGAIFFQAFQKTMKSTDGGRAWANTNAPSSAPPTLDPYMW